MHTHPTPLRSAGASIQTLLKRPFVRQLLGGVAGALLALVLYSIYEEASGLFQAMVMPPEGVITDEMRAEKIVDVAARAREALEELH